MRYLSRRNVLAGAVACAAAAAAMAVPPASARADAVTEWNGNASTTIVVTACSRRPSPC